MLRGGYERELAAASYPHIHCGGGERKIGKLSGGPKAFDVSGLLAGVERSKFGWAGIPGPRAGRVARGGAAKTRATPRFAGRFGKKFASYAFCS